MTTLSNASSVPTEFCRRGEDVATSAVTLVGERLVARRLARSQCEAGCGSKGPLPRRHGLVLRELLAYVSRGTELRPGDVIGSGTIPGGCLLEHVDTPDMADYKGWLRDGDSVPPVKRRSLTPRSRPRRIVRRRVGRPRPCRGSDRKSVV